MIIWQTIKRRMQRAIRNPISHAGYRNLTGPALHFEVSNGYSCEISYEDLANLVRLADKYAADKNIPGLKNWRGDPAVKNWIEGTGPDPRRPGEIGPNGCYPDPSELDQGGTDAQGNQIE